MKNTIRATSSPPPPAGLAIVPCMGEFPVQIVETGVEELSFDATSMIFKKPEAPSDLCCLARAHLA